jgi:hypothetical protein
LQKNKSQEKLDLNDKHAKNVNNSVRARHRGIFDENGVPNELFTIDENLPKLLQKKVGSGARNSMDLKPRQIRTLWQPSIDTNQNSMFSSL